MQRYPQAIQAAIRILVKNKTERDQKDWDTLHQLLSDSSFYNTVRDKYGEDGVNSFIRGLYLMKSTSSEGQHSKIYWIFVLYGSIKIDSKKLGSGQSFLFGDLPHDMVLQPMSLVLAINQDRMNKIISTFQIGISYKITKQLTQVPLFSSIEYVDLQQIANMVRVQYCTKDAVVYPEGKHASTLYIISKGSFMMKKKVNYDRENRMEKKANMTQRKKYIDVVSMSVFDIFGQECLNMVHDSDQSCTFSRYQSEVRCQSSEGKLYCLNLSCFDKPPLEQYLSLPAKILCFYEDRRKMIRQSSIEKVMLTDEEKKKQEEEKKLQNYLSKLYDQKSYSNPNYIRIKRHYTPDMEFFTIDQIGSMKLKLKYQNILEKIDKMKTLSDKSLNRNGRSKSNFNYRSRTNLQKRIIMKELERQKSTSMLIQSQTIGSFRIQSQSTTLIQPFREDSSQNMNRTMKSVASMRTRKPDSPRRNDRKIPRINDRVYNFLKRNMRDVGLERLITE